MLLRFKGRLERTLLVLLYLDHGLFRLHVHSQEFRLLVQRFLLLPQLVEGLEEGLDAALARFSQRTDDGLCFAHPLPQNSRLRGDPLHILDQVVKVFLVRLFFAIKTILRTIVLMEDGIHVGHLPSDIMLFIY